MALKITENIIIDDIDEVISRMQELIGPETFDINSMVNFIENEKQQSFTLIRRCREDQRVIELPYTYG